MKALTTKLLEATYAKLNPNKEDFCFQIFGLDFILDENFKLWLIEVNANPSLETNVSLLYKVIGSMIDNAFKIALDPYFRVKEENPKNKKWSYKEHFKNNKFCLIFEQELKQ